jgi:uncharacterized membrane protein YeaQ/YmgE (transglycosylase-associated protein family)
MDITTLIIQLVGGAIGGNGAGAALKNLSLGTTGNSIVGIIGGVVAGQLLPMLGLGGGEAAASLDIASILTNLVGGGVGGGVLLAIVGAVKKAMAK